MSSDSTLKKKPSPRTARVEATLRTMFMVSFVVGLVGVVAEWVLAAPPLGLLAAVGAMLVYVFLGHRAEPDGIASPQFADSVYYLGFLFTICALIISLIDLGDSLASADDTFEGLVWRFGLALVTTVLGLAIRVYLAGFHDKLEDSLITSEKALARSARQMRKQLQQQSIDFRAQNELHNKSLQSAVKFASNSLVTSVRDAQAVAENTSREASQTVAVATGEFVEKVRESAEDATSALKDELKRLGGAIGSLSADLAASKEQFSERLLSGPFPGEAWEAKAQPELDRVAEKLSGIGTSFDTLEERTTVAADNVATMSEKWLDAGAAASSAGDQAQAMKQLGEEVSAVLGGVQQLSRELAGIGGLSKDVERLSDAIREATQSMRDAAGARRVGEVLVRSEDSAAGAAASPPSPGNGSNDRSASVGRQDS